jgi:ribosomal protein S27AE
LAEEVKIEYDDFGFVKNRLCPQCGSSQLRFSHKDDVGTQWFKCQKCGRYCTLTKTEERKRLEEALAKPKEPQPIMLSHLNMIEDPSLAGKPVAVEALVSSTSVAYLCPMEVEASGSDDEGFDITTHKQIRPEDPLNLQLISVNEAVKYRRLKRFLGLSRDANIQEKGYRTVYRIRVRPPVFTLEKRGEKIVDERGFEYKALDIYVVAEKPIVFQPSSLVRVEGTPLPNPKTQQTTLLAYKVDFPEENTTFDKEKLNTLKEKFEGLSFSERVNWILDNFERFSKIVGRRNLAMAGFLAYFTPLWVRFDGMLQRGWGNILFCGDTTTAKTETIRRLIMLLKAGMLITAETATAVGLTGTATQVEKEGWFVDWGFLVLLGS